MPEDVGVELEAVAILAVDAGVHERSVEAPQEGQRLVERVLDVRLDCDIAGTPRRRIAERGKGRVELCRVPSANEDPRALGDEAPGSGEAHARRAAGDEHSPPLMRSAHSRRSRASEVGTGRLT